MTDERLVETVQNGDIAAFEILVKRYQKRLLAFVLRILRDEDDASDAVQEALFKAYKAMDRIDTERKFSTYLFGIAKNEAINLLRRRKKHLTLDTVSVPETGGLTVFEQTAFLELREKLQIALRRMDRKYRKIITLYYFHDLHYDEIAKKLAIPVNTVRTHLKRGKERLGKELRMIGGV